MGSFVESGAVAGDVAGPGARGVVSRPRLFERLGAARVTVVSAPPGSGKTVLLRSWIGRPGAAGRAAWVPVGRGERDPRRFWLSVLGALRQTGPGSVLVQPLAAAPDLDGRAVAERLVTELAPLRGRLWLVADDVQELGPEALGQLELLIMRAPPGLRFVLAARHDVQLGLHRLRLGGDLAEIRESDLRFTVAEARELFDVAGVKLPDPALLVERTEGWAAGLRLAALSLAGHEDPERFAEQFSGTERTVAEYLLAEVLDRQSQEARRLLLRTAILERVSGELADLLTGDSGGERVLQDLEQANAFVVALDARRSWFRYHRMFADLLQLQLRRTEPGEVTALHRAAAGWFARHGYPVEAIRHARAARDWNLAAVLLAGHWPGLYPDGQGAIPHGLGRARNADVLSAFQAAGRTAGRPAEPGPMVHGNRSFLVQTLVRPGKAQHAERVLPGLGGQDRNGGAMRIGLATLRLARDNPREAIAALAPDPESLLAEGKLASPGGPQPPREALSDSEIRVLRYLPTNLTAPEIARELYISLNTVKTHMRNLYAKLGAHRRAEAVERGRALGLLASSPPPGWARTPADRPGS